MQRIGRYVIEDTLGQGGMGMVYRARDSVIGREVALKVIQEQALSEATKERFYKEARSAGRLSHDNIMTLHDVGEEAGTPYLVMELLDGTDLRHLLHGEALGDEMPLPLAEKLDIALQICRGLQYAHNREVIHRDIKPENIRVLENGRVKIMDFGLARIESDTLTHTSMGTPRYMSPEQVKGEHIDHRTDVFSFGVLFYELLTGTNPFSGERISSIIYKILHEEPEPIQIEDHLLSAELQKIVARCIEKEAERRYGDFGAVIEELEEVAAAQRGTRTLPRTLTGIDRKEAAPDESTSHDQQTASSSVRRMALGMLVFASVAGGGYLVFQSLQGAGRDDEVRIAGATTSVEAPALPQQPEAPADTLPSATKPEEVAHAGPGAEQQQQQQAPSSEAAVRKQRQAQADRSRQAMQLARRQARKRHSHPAKDEGYRQAEALQTRGNRRYENGDFAAAAQSFKEARTLYARIKEPVDEEPKPSPEPETTGNRAEADRILTRTREAKASVRPALQQQPTYRQALRLEQQGAQAYAARSFDRAAEHFEEAEALFNEVAAMRTPRDVAQRAVQNLTARLKRSLEAEDVDDLHSLSDFYARNTWTGFFNVAEDITADVRAGAVNLAENTATVSVSARLEYLNNKQEKQQNRLQYVWTLAKTDGGTWTLKTVENR